MKINADHKVKLMKTHICQTNDKPSPQIAITAESWKIRLSIREKGDDGITLNHYTAKHHPGKPRQHQPAGLLTHRQ